MILSSHASTYCTISWPSSRIPITHLVISRLINKLSWLKTNFGTDCTLMSRRIHPPSSRIFGTDKTDGTAPDVDHHHAQNPDWKPGTDCQLMGSPQLESIGARFEVVCTVVQYAVQRLTLHSQSLSWPQKTLWTLPAAPCTSYRITLVVARGCSFGPRCGLLPGITMYARPTHMPSSVHTGKPGLIRAFTTSLACIALVSDLKSRCRSGLPRTWSLGQRGEGHVSRNETMTYQARRPRTTVQHWTNLTYDCVQCTTVSLALLQSQT
jgi:hypothetical protein